MKRRLLSAAPMLVALFVVVGLALALGACGAGGAKEQAKGRPLPKDQGPLRPGEYHSLKFKPALSFKVGKGWATESPETSDTLPLGWKEGGGMSFANVKKVYKPTEPGTPSFSSDLKVVETPKDLAGWLQNNPYIETTK